MSKLTLAYIALFLCVAGLFSALKPWLPMPGDIPIQKAPPAQKHLTRCIGLSVYDGDTFGCDLNGNRHMDGQEEHIRMLGIDAAEMYYSAKNLTGKDEPCAREALDFVKQYTLQKPVYLEWDETRFDKYDRSLVYAYVDPQGKRMLNAMLLEKGLAKVLFIGNNRRYEAAFAALETQAPSPGYCFFVQKMR